jgi:hypothetical protein
VSGHSWKFPNCHYDAKELAGDSLRKVDGAAPFVAQRFWRKECQAAESASNNDITFARDGRLRSTRGRGSACRREVNRDPWRSCAQLDSSVSLDFPHSAIPLNPVRRPANIGGPDYPPCVPRRFF